MDVLMRSKTDT